MAAEDTAVAAVEAPPVEEVVAPVEQPETVLVAEAPRRTGAEPRPKTPSCWPTPPKPSPADSPALTEVETVAAAVMDRRFPGPRPQGADLRSVEPAPNWPRPKMPQDEVVVVKSTSGGRTGA
jgi:hypothetical protein